ncbi:hypothetical protein GWI33_013620 [Rhynchophorus ferrugineus]|uniref:Uncharacterized protein n=1 Tax=Rhynchophorus ferrugineus TaxID=354439 RepID=A0A834M7N3_RHYFE|nr:hypothetical protein GWI33_013620 [Rhynchophorus ferrugineus]
MNSPYPNSSTPGHDFTTANAKNVTGLGDQRVYIFNFMAAAKRNRRTSLERTHRTKDRRRIGSVPSGRSGKSSGLRCQRKTRSQTIVNGIERWQTTISCSGQKTVAKRQNKRPRALAYGSYLEQVLADKDHHCPGLETGEDIREFPFQCLVESPLTSPTPKRSDKRTVGECPWIAPDSLFMDATIGLPENNNAGCRLLGFFRAQFNKSPKSHPIK